ncbi:hypothetical protein HDU84_004788 [Entophlyctis sp. JEL0112]|nr:hypothetical protein HDU84_004788 [Entophlyctis sp. JEL0112]
MSLHTLDSVSDREQPSPIPDSILVRAPLLPHGSPSSTSPRHLSFALRPGNSQGVEQPAPSPLAALAASVTARLVWAHHLHHQSLRSTSALVQLKRFAASVLNTHSITPSTPIIVLHALLLIHRILSRSHAGSSGGGSGGGGNSTEGDNGNLDNFDNFVAAALTSRSSAVPVDSQLMTHASSSLRNLEHTDTRHLPPSLHTPANLLLAGLLLADSFFSDLPARAAVLTAMVGAEATIPTPQPLVASDSVTAAAVAATSQDTLRSSFPDVASAAVANPISDKTTALSALDIKRDALNCLAWRVGVGEIEFAKWCTVVKRWSSTSAVSVLA